MEIVSINQEGIIIAKWNEDGKPWSDNDVDRRHEAHHFMDGPNCVLRMYRRWEQDDQYWRPGQLGYAINDDAGLNNLPVKDVVIPPDVHAAILEAARERYGDQMAEAEEAEAVEEKPKPKKTRKSASKK